MNTVTLSAFKTNIESTIQGIVSTHQPVVVKKDRRSSVVLMPLEDYRALTETKYLLSSPANVDRLVRGIEEIEQIIAGETGEDHTSETHYPPEKYRSHSHGH